MSEDVIARLVDGGVVAVLRGIGAADIIPVARAVLEGGISALEVTMDARDAVDSLELVEDTFGDDALVGAGTVLDAETAQAAINVGAEFVVSPSLNTHVIEHCNRYSIPSVPGVTTPTEAITALEAGAQLVKLFPAAALGPQYLASLHGPFTNLRVMPTGGIDADNAGEFIEAGASVVGAGSSIVDDEAVRNGEFDVVTDRAQRLRKAVDDAR